MPTVTPGKVFIDGELVTRAKLNQLGNPIVELNDADTDILVAAVRQTIPTINRNVLINGNFDVWERGGYANLSGLPTYMGEGTGAAMGADRWALVTPSGASKRRISRMSFTTGQSDVPNEPSAYLRWNELVAETGVNRPMLSQLIEDVRTLAGKSAVVTWWMKGNYSGNVTCSMRQFLGGSPGDTVAVSATSGGTAAVVNDNSWRQYTAKFDIPSLAGKSLSTNHYLALDFVLRITSRSR